MTSCFQGSIILGDGQIAIEAKSSDNITSDHFKGLRAWKQEHPQSRCILVSRVARARMTEDKIEILPWRAFLKMLWKGAVIPAQ